MFKTVVTLLRGQAHNAAQDLADRNAAVLLDQQIRDAALTFGDAKRALAVALVQDQAEAARLERLDAAIADLETRALAALQGGRRDLAEAASATLAAMELDRRDGTALREKCAADLAGMRESVADAQRRLLALDSGRRKALAMAAVQRLHAQASSLSGDEGSALAQAEATLARLEQRSREAAAVQSVEQELDALPRPEKVTARLAEAGFGQRLVPDARDVLARLEARLALPPAAAD